MHLLKNILKNNSYLDSYLDSIQCYDIICHSADAVLSAGLRRSALICLFDKNGEQMINSKTGDWYITNPQRGRSNNSVKLIKGQYTKEEYEEKIKQFSKQIGIISLNASLSTSNSKNMEIWTPFLKRCLQLLNENAIKEIQFVFILLL